MSAGFSDDWLALREGADARARAGELLPALARALPPGADSLRVLDLGAGTGANARWLAPRLAALGLRRQHWVCADHDPALRACLPSRCADFAGAAGLACLTTDEGLSWHGPDWTCTLHPRAADLATDLAPGPAGEPSALELPAGGLVTASALLDLVSLAWLDGLLAAARRCHLLFALSYDGRCTLTPAHADDARLIASVNRHQRTDKGFGPALGPTAAAHAAARAQALGWTVGSAPSDWVIGADQPDLQWALIDGWCAAALALSGDAARWIGRWRSARAAAIVAGELTVRVGHQDLVAVRP